MPANPLTFPPFRLDSVNACLWRGTKRLVLPPKDFAVLHYLVTHAGQLVTHEELLKAVWPDAIVSAKGLKAFVRRLRQVLGDKAAKSRFIETVHGQGYRFIGQVVSSQHSVVSNPPPPTQSSVLSPQSSVLVGREAELAQLHRWLEKVQSGERQIVFVTGEPGIGKTSLLEAFVAGVHDQEKSQKSKACPERSRRVKSQKSKGPLPQSAICNPQSPIAGVWLGWGQCIEHYGAGEPYMPVLEALGRLARTPDGEQLKGVLEQHAPTWLAQMPGLLSAAELQALQPRVLRATRERMLREIAEALEVLTAERTLVLVLEDLHWADVSTLELLALLARRREQARLLVVGTYRPLEVLGNGHPLNGMIHELHAHGLCGELVLRLLSEEDVAMYLQTRFPRSVFPTRLAEVLHRRTEGNPLFVVSAIDDLVKQGIMLQVDEDWVLQGDMERFGTEVPESVRHLVARQRERLQPDEQHVLEAASVAGMEFSVAAVAAALETEVVAVGEQCARLGERQQFLRPAGIAEWPDGTVAARYGFVHALYQHLWSEQVSIEKQQQWHLRVGERKEAAWGPQAHQIAAELTVHFEQGRDYSRAIRYLQQAGESALQRSAHQEAIAHLTRGLELLQTLPDTPERIWRELTLHVTLGAPLLMSRGYTAPEVKRTYDRAYQLCQQVGENPQLFPALFGLFRFYILRADLLTARDLAERLLRLAQGRPDPLFLPAAHAALGGVLFYLGELPAARASVEQGIAAYNRHLHGPLVFQYGEDAGVICQDFAAWVLYTLGYPDQALARIRTALALAQELSHPHTLGGHFGAWAIFSQHRRESETVRERAQAAIVLFTAQGGGPGWVTFATILHGWALASRGQAEEGIAQILQGLRTLQSVGVNLWRPFFLGLLAEAYREGGKAGEGLAALDEALATASHTGQRWYEAELYRLRGELMLAQEDKIKRQKAKIKNQKAKIKTSPQPLAPSTQAEVGKAEKCFLKAIEIAKHQHAKSLELRAVMNLARLWQRQGKHHAAHNMLSETYGWFTEGFDTKDLQEAKALLEALH